MNFKGFPGTTGVAEHDWLVADRVVTPPDFAAGYVACRSCCCFLTHAPTHSLSLTHSLTHTHTHTHRYVEKLQLLPHSYHYNGHDGLYTHMYHAGPRGLTKSTGTLSQLCVCVYPLT